MINLHRNSDNGKPYINPLYLSKTVEASQEGFPPIVAFSEETDPKAIQNSKGQFIFTDITPGKYALILWSPVGSFPIQDKNNQGEYLIFEVDKGVITDLGTISLP